MPLILIGIITVIGVVAYLIHQKVDKKKKRFSSPGCSACSINEGTFHKVVAKRDIYSHNGNTYTMTYYFKCSKCGTEETVKTRCIIEYKIDRDVIEAVRAYAQREWGIAPLFIPYHVVEIQY